MSRITPPIGGVAANVRRGAKLLDAVRPGWAAKVSLDRLAMQSCDRCVLGQVYGSYQTGFREVVAAFDGPYQGFQASVYGFTLPMATQNAAVAHLGEDGTQEAYEEALGPLFAPLAEAWREEIRARVPA